jgi:hypothetical protein
MTVCLKCGAENPVTNQYCARCEMPLPHSGVGRTLQGGPLERPGGTAPLLVPSPAATSSGVAPRATPAAVAPASGLAHTLFGVAPGAGTPAALPAAGAGTAAAAPGLGQTLFGVAPAGAQLGARQPGVGSRLPGATAASPAQTSPGSLAAAPSPANLGQRTLMGVAPQAFGTHVSPSADAAPSRRQPAPQDPGAVRARPSNTAPFEPVRNAATQLGTTSSFPQLARAPESPSAETAPIGSGALPSAANAAVAAPEPAPSVLPPLPSATANPVHARTHLGVAIPGIAPLRSSVAAAAVPPPAATEEVFEPAPAPLSAPSRFRVPRSALVLLGSGVVLLAAAVAFALLWTGARPISASVAADPSGKERIDLVCSDCPDGTQLSLDGVIAEVRDRKAYLVPSAPLALGENTLHLAVQRPGTSTKSVDVRLPPLEYRIRADTSTLVGDQPRLRLDIETLPGTSVQLGPDSVKLDAAGRGQQAIDVSGQLLGPSGDIATFEQAVPYAISSPSGKQYRGELRVKIGITPLLLEAPGTDSVTDLERFMLAGRTTSGAEVSVAGAALPVDASGRFAQLMSIESVGQTNVTVRATQRGLAPRFASFRLERVKSLESALSTRRQGALALADVVKDIGASVGKTVLVRGRIEEVRVDGQRSLLILAADRDCAASECLARLSYGGLRKLARGTRVTAIGKVLGAAASQNVPEIEVSLLL